MYSVSHLVIEWRSLYREYIWPEDVLTQCGAAYVKIIGRTIRSSPRKSGIAPKFTWGMTLVRTRFTAKPGYKEKVKLFLQQALETHKVVRRSESQIFYETESQMAASASLADRPITP
jgi:hypothetical protein